MRLRTLLVLAVIAGGLLPGASPAGAATDASTKYRIDALRAQWFLPTDDADQVKSYVVLVTRRTNVDTDESVVTAAAGRGRCSLSNGMLESCMTYLSRYRVAEFEADAAFATARAVVKRGRWTHEVSFTAGQPYVYAPPAAQNPTNACEGGTVTTIYLTARNATAEGTVFGQKVSTAAEIDAERESEKMVQTMDLEECP